MRIFYAIYAVGAIGFLYLYLQQVGSLPGRLALWGHITLCVAALIAVAMRMRRWPWVGLAAVVPLVGILLVDSVLYIAFIIEHRGLDCGTCDGSPMALILNWAFELIFLIPGLVLCLWMARTIRRTWRP
jgi:ATP/ADP translocase